MNEEVKAINQDQNSPKWSRFGQKAVLPVVSYFLSLPPLPSSTILFWGPSGFMLKSTPQSNTQGTSWSGLYPCCQLYFLPCTPFQSTTLAKSNHFIVPVLYYRTCYVPSMHQLILPPRLDCLSQLRTHSHLSLCSSGPSFMSTQIEWPLPSPYQ